MYRSFTDRVLAGVCGGLAAPLPVNAWVVRILFVVLALLTLGAFGVLYLMLWLALPQASLTREPGGRGLLWGLLALVLAVGVLGGWYGRLQGLTQVSGGGDIYYPALFLVLSLIFLSRQIGRAL